MGKLTYQVSKLGVEDLEMGVGSSQQVRGSKTVTVTKINASNLPFDENNTLQEVLDTNYPSIDTVATNIDSVNSVISLKDVIILISSMKDTLNSLYNDKATLDSLFGDKATLDSLFGDKATLDSLFNDKNTLDSLFADKSKLDSIYGDRSKLDSLYNDKATLDSLFADKSKLDSLFGDKATLDNLYSNLYAMKAVNEDLFKGVDTILIPNSIYPTTDLRINRTAGQLADGRDFANQSELLAALYNLRDDLGWISSSTVIEATAEGILIYSAIGATTDILNMSLDGVTYGFRQAEGSNIVNLGAMIPTLDSIYNDKVTLDSLYNDKENLDALFDNLQAINDAYGNASTATAKALESTAKSLESEAAFKTAQSYATEPEDEYVKEYISNGDGTFTSTTTNVYSALHYRLKAESIVDNGALLSGNNLSDLTSVTEARMNIGLDEDVLAIQANSQAIANMATAQGSIVNENTPEFSEIPQVATVLPFVVDSDSTDAEIFTFDAINDTITLNKSINYNFLSLVTFESSTNATRTVTFNLVDTSDESIIKQQTATLEIANGNKITIPMNTLLTLGSNGIPNAPLTIRIDILCSGDGYSLNSFKSTLTSAAIATLVTTEPVISITSFVNESSSTLGTISNYDSLATYTITATTGSIDYISGNTFIYIAPDVTDGDNDTDTISVYATKAGELRSDVNSTAIEVVYVPVVADTTIQVTDISNDLETNTGFEEIV